MKTGPFLFTLAAALTVASSSQAQATPSADASAVESVSSDSSATPPHVAVPSSIDASAAVRRTVAATAGAGVALAPTNKGLGKAKALMGVGVAGFVAGAFIGNDGGHILMFGSAVVGLYGLYLYLQ